MNQDEIFKRISRTGPIDAATISFLYSQPIGEIKAKLDELVASGELTYDKGKYDLSESFNGAIEHYLPQAIEKQKVEQETVQKIKSMQGNKEVRPKTGRVRKTLPGIQTQGIFERLVLKFAHVLQYFAFLITSLADLFLSVFFYFSLGYDVVSKIALMLWGVVTVGAKLYGWSYRKYALGVWCAVLSVFASMSIFLAVIDLQASNTELNNNTATVTNQIDVRISSLEADRIAQVKRRDALPVDYSTAIKAANLDISKIDEQLNKLIDKKELSGASIEKVNQVEIKLSSWDIFRQLTSIPWNDPAHVLAFIFIVLLAGLLDYTIFITTPRQSNSLESKRDRR